MINFDMTSSHFYWLREIISKLEHTNEIKLENLFQMNTNVKLYMLITLRIQLINVYQIKIMITLITIQRVLKQSK